MTSDQLIPRLSLIVDRALDIRDSAVRLHDDAAVRQIDRLIAKLPGARLCWTLGTLHIVSPSGGAYRVSRAGCSCLNARKGQHACWHVAAYNLLLDMFDTECESSDQAADIGALFAERLAATAQIVQDMRRAQGGRQCSIWV